MAPPSLAREHLDADLTHCTLLVLPLQQVSLTFPLPSVGLKSHLAPPQAILPQLTSSQRASMLV